MERKQAIGVVIDDLDDLRNMDNGDVIYLSFAERYQPYVLTDLNANCFARFRNASSYDGLLQFDGYQAVIFQQHTQIGHGTWEYNEGGILVKLDKLISPNRIIGNNIELLLDVVGSPRTLITSVKETPKMVGSDLLFIEWK